MARVGQLRHHPGLVADPEAAKAHKQGEGATARADQADDAVGEAWQAVAPEHQHQGEQASAEQAIEQRVGEDLPEQRLPEAAEPGEQLRQRVAEQHQRGGHQPIAKGASLRKAPHQCAGEPQDLPLPRHQQQHGQAHQGHCEGGAHPDAAVGQAHPGQAHAHDREAVDNQRAAHKARQQQVEQQRARPEQGHGAPGGRVDSAQVGGVGLHRELRQAQRLGARVGPEARGIGEAVGRVELDAQVGARGPGGQRKAVGGPLRRRREAAKRNAVGAHRHRGLGHRGA